MEKMCVHIWLVKELTSWKKIIKGKFLRFDYSKGKIQMGKDEELLVEKYLQNIQNC